MGFKKPHAPWGIPGRFYDAWNTSALPVATHGAASPGVPDVALIHDFPVTIENGSVRVASGPHTPHTRCTMPGTIASPNSKP